MRFTRTERAVHWVQASTFLLLLATGFILGLVPLETFVGHRAGVREIHLIAAFFFVFGPSVVALAGNRSVVGDDVQAVDQWSEDDVRWLGRPALDPQPETPPAGKFNAGQKLNAIFTAYSTVAFGLTGLILWQNRRFPFDLVSQARTIHSLLAYVALAVFLGHFYLAVIHPATRAALHSMIFGTVSRSWAEHHHPRWPSPASEPRLRLGTVVRSCLLLLLGLEIALLASRILLIWLGANTTDPVAGFIYAWSGLPGVASPTTAVHVLDLVAVFWTGAGIALWQAVARGHDLLPRTLLPRE